MPMIYFKPLLKGKKRPMAAMTAMLLHRLGTLAVEEIKHEIDRSPIKSKANIKRSIEYKVMPSSVTISSDHPGFVFLEQGVRPHTMVYARNKVIAIDLEDLRGWPTARDRRQGIAFRRTGLHKTKAGHTLPDPKHPGIDPMRFVRKGIKKARERLIEDIKTEVLQGF